MTFRRNAVGKDDLSDHARRKVSESVQFIKAIIKGQGKHKT